MADWKNFTAIEQDLFVAQGRPISIDTGYSVSYNNQPPVYQYHEGKYIIIPRYLIK